MAAWGIFGTPAYGIEYLANGIEIDIVTGKPPRENREELIRKGTLVSDGKGGFSLNLGGSRESS